MLAVAQGTPSKAGARPWQGRARSACCPCATPLPWPPRLPAAGSGPYSTARWNPFGRFLVLAGIGNLPGDLAFYDKKADGKCKPMGRTR